MAKIVHLAVHLPHQPLLSPARKIDIPHPSGKEGRQ